jgi:hypothetical protein
MEAFADWLAGTRASYFIQVTLWIIPTVQTIHILGIAMVFSSVMMVVLSILGFSKSYTIEEVAQRFVPWIYYGVAALAVTGAILIVGEPQRSLPSYEFKMKMLWLAVAMISTVAFGWSVRHNAMVWQPAVASGKMQQQASARRMVNGLAIAVLASWCMVVIYGRWIAYTVAH